MGDDRDFDSLLTYLKRVPAVEPSIGDGRWPDKKWWVKFSLDIRHPLAWHVVQEFGFVLNYISLNERLPTVFKPVSPPPYLNGGPRHYLSWVIECDDPSLKPGSMMKTLEGRLPRPVDDLDQWKHHDDDES